jgi:hypothetical protein
MTFQTFTGREYLKIDIASNFGLEKEDWDARLAWFDEHEQELDSLVKKAEEPALFFAGVNAWKRVKEGKPSGYPISLDATSSGIQLLAALSCDRQAASLCNVIDTGHRQDAYVSLYHDMVNRVGETAKINRKDTKTAIMTFFYNSKAEPKRVFGEGELLDTFYETMKDNAPGPCEITDTMLAIWDPQAYSNEWVLPDNFHVVVKVMGQVRETVHFLNEPFEVTYNVNMPIEGGRSLGANMVHSIDGMVVREMQRRCHYNVNKVAELHRWINVGVAGRSTRRPQDKLVMVLWDHYQKSGFLSARIIDYLDMDNLGLVKWAPVQQLLYTLPAKPFELISVHDCFRCLPNYGNDLRRQYNNLLAEIAESDLLSYIISQIVGRQIKVNKLDPTLSNDIRETNYALS